MAPNAPEAQDGSIATEEAKYFSDGHPTVMPEKPVLTPSNTNIYESNQFVPQGRPATMIAQPHPHDRVTAIVYSPEELAAMGFEVTVPHSLVDFEHGAAELVPEKRDPRRVTVETSKKLGLALNPQEEQSQKTKEFEGAKARLERHLDTLAAAIKTAYEQKLAEKFPKPEIISDETIRRIEIAVGNELSNRHHYRIADAIIPGSLRPFLEATAKQARQNEIDKFNTEDNFTWENMLSTIASNSTERYFHCTTDMVEPLLQAGIAPRIVQLDDNPKHTVTISISSKSDLHTNPTQSNIVADILHESGESFADRYRKRNPPRPSRDRGYGGGH